MSNDEDGPVKEKEQKIFHEVLKKDTFSFKQERARGKEEKSRTFIEQTQSIIEKIDQRYDSPSKNNNQKAGESGGFSQMNNVKAKIKDYVADLKNQNRDYKEQLQLLTKKLKSQEEAYASIKEQRNELDEKTKLLEEENMLNSKLLSESCESHEKLKTRIRNDLQLEIQNLSHREELLVKKNMLLEINLNQKKEEKSILQNEFQRLNSHHQMIARKMNEVEVLYKNECRKTGRLSDELQDRVEELKTMEASYTELESNLQNEISANEEDKIEIERRMEVLEENIHELQEEKHQLQAKVLQFKEKLQKQTDMYSRDVQGLEYILNSKINDLIEQNNKLHEDKIRLKNSYQSQLEMQKLKLSSLEKVNSCLEDKVSMLTKENEIIETNFIKLLSHKEKRAESFDSDKTSEEEHNSYNKPNSSNDPKNIHNTKACIKANDVKKESISNAAALTRTNQVLIKANEKLEEALRKLKVSHEHELNCEKDEYEQKLKLLLADITNTTIKNDYLKKTLRRVGAAFNEKEIALEQNIFFLSNQCEKYETRCYRYTWFFIVASLFVIVNYHLSKEQILHRIEDFVSFSEILEPKTLHKISNESPLQAILKIIFQG